MRRQGMAGAARYATSELADLEARISTAGERALELELALFRDLRQAVLAQGAHLAEVAGALAEADVTAALAELGHRAPLRPPRRRRQPRLPYRGRPPPRRRAGLGPRQPALRRQRLRPRPDQPPLAPHRPEHGRQEHLPRQNALIALLAQAGSFVPAASARIGVVDRLFSRVGAADDLARGRSTFMVEMVEAAAILNLATTRSLVILDEVGRGTSTYDGLSIAWAVVEHLHEATAAAPCSPPTTTS
jgi:DNA mismatch repair protein MutS